MDRTTDPFRPRTWDDYKGQDRLKDRLRIQIESAKMREKPLDHMLLVAPPGYGKTSIASIVATEMGMPFRSFAERLAPMVFDAIVRRFTGVVLLDEIHNWTDAEQGRLLTLVEDGYVQSWTGERVHHNGLTIIAATTEGDRVLAPLYQRFRIKPPFDDYSQQDMVEILKGMAHRLDDLPLSDDLINSLARASCGTPRVASELLVMTRDMLIVNKKVPTPSEVFGQIRITSTGLSEDHIRYLRSLQALGGTAGLETIKHHVRLPKDVLLDLERLLVRQRLLTYTTRGRVLTVSGNELSRRIDG